MWDSKATRCFVYFRHAFCKLKEEKLHKFLSNFKRRPIEEYSVFGNELDILNSLMFHWRKLRINVWFKKEQKAINEELSCDQNARSMGNGIVAAVVTLSPKKPHKPTLGVKFLSPDFNMLQVSDPCVIHK